MYMLYKPRLATRTYYVLSCPRRPYSKMSSLLKELYHTHPKSLNGAQLIYWPLGLVLLSFQKFVDSFWKLVQMIDPRINLVDCILRHALMRSKLVVRLS